jgi:hypothetical protein
LRELKNMSRKSGEKIMENIVNYSENLYAMNSSEKPNKAQQVLSFLRMVPEFREHVQKTLDRLYGEGLITIPSHLLRTK